ncbi:hypothetical protein H6758_04920 [Candidatus Nomurabacteria bacterium]|nr:hypothetical protein [Candidatus Nomurabacteria bacterium]
MDNLKNAGWIVFVAVAIGLVLMGHAKIVIIAGVLTLAGYALMHVLAISYSIVLIVKLVLWISTSMITHDWRWRDIRIVDMIPWPTAKQMLIGSALYSAIILGIGYAGYQTMSLVMGVIGLVFSLATLAYHAWRPDSPYKRPL